MKTGSKNNRRTLQLYVLGFAWSVILTLGAYVAVVNQLLARRELILYIMVLALIQVWVQLYFFLHLGSEAKPRWNAWTFLFMSLILLVIVIGSLWIMHNLNYNMMPSHETDEYMLKEGNKGF